MERRRRGHTSEKRLRARGDVESVLLTLLDGLDRLAVHLEKLPKSGTSSSHDTHSVTSSGKKWKQLLQSRGRSFIFSTSIPLPVAAAAHGKYNFVLHLACFDGIYQVINIDSTVIPSIIVAKEEKWRRMAIWSRVQEFQALTGIPITSPIISLVVGSEEKALRASRHLLESGFHVTAIRPPTVPPNACRLRVTLTAAHTKDDIKKFASALSVCMKFSDVDIKNFNGYSKL
ncbi:hypothetical protein GIB67_008599 [Kingdonia uniflora]|uniref:Aminotransferase class I/classII large domain-containing protein n=1 Tax=Kingdonia uniflora TaxID=39325 RepID=A0A7J7M531_9MAGN|nr:hypothetical protein GIB67_008599 [Kingdonia uniflora]